MAGLPKAPSAALTATLLAIVLLFGQAVGAVHLHADGPVDAECIACGLADTPVAPQNAACALGPRPTGAVAVPRRAAATPCGADLPGYAPRAPPASIRRSIH